MTPTRDEIQDAALSVESDLTPEQLEHVVGRVDAIYWWADIVRTVRHHMADGHACDPADAYTCPGAHVLDVLGRAVYAQIGRDREEVAA